MTAVTAKLLRDTAKAIRPHVETLLDLRDIFADYRTAITDAGGDWMALKNLVKAQIEDERDEDGKGKRVRKIIDRADFASAYADILGLNAKLNENNSFDEAVAGITDENRHPEIPISMPTVDASPAPITIDASDLIPLTDGDGFMVEDMPSHLRRVA